MSGTLNIAVLEPYYGGSHASFVDAVMGHTRHRCRLVTLPARKWKWRMRGAAIWFARQETSWMDQGKDGPLDAILASDMLSVADLRALLPANLRHIPVVCYFHENQLTYPLPDESTRDYQYGMTNISSGLAADAVWFNSGVHLEAFLAAAGKLLAKMPDFIPQGAVNEIRSKATVLAPPVMVAAADRPRREPGAPIRLLWCHRWEYDKNPEPFFAALVRLHQAAYRFELVLLGEQFRTAPPAFADAADRLRSHIVHQGFIADRREYLSTIAGCDLVVSTAVQENFGIAVAEAILAGCQPLLPGRLSYPELIPREFHQTCLYPTDGDLFDRLREVIQGPGRLDATTLDKLRRLISKRFGVKSRVAAIDDALNDVVGKRPSQPTGESWRAGS